MRFRYIQLEVASTRGHALDAFGSLQCLRILKDLNWIQNTIREKKRKRKLRSD